MKYLIVFFLAVISFQAQDLTYKIIDTGQEKCYNNIEEIEFPNQGDDYYGQDAQYNGFQPAYKDNGDGTITDLNTGLMWQSGLLEDKYSYYDAISMQDTFSLAGYNDWRLPTIKELYSLVMFYGNTGMDDETSIPFLDTNYFEFRYGGTVNPSERFIDAQYVTSTTYTGTTMTGNPTVFGYNFVDGRIKGYPQFMDFEVKFVRGRNDYGINNFVDNGDNTITDLATGLMWEKHGSSEGYRWKEALEYVVQKNSENYLGYSDWRLPNAKELQSIIDYSNAPLVNGKPAIDDIFEIPEIEVEEGNFDYAFYWTNTTHSEMVGNKAVYICFGTAYGFLPPPLGNYQLTDVHGAGAQRSDFKEGEPEDYPVGYGPQGDVIRIYNHILLVRDSELLSSVGNEIGSSIPEEFNLMQNYPNPFNPSTKINFSLPESSDTRLKVYDILGNEIANLVNENLQAGNYSVNFDGTSLSSGIYIYSLEADNKIITKKMTLLK